MQEIITCKNCENQFTGKFCNQCGEKVYLEKDKNLSHLFEEVFHFFTHFDGSFLTTLKTFLRHPGKLSADYCSGIRKKYFKPIPFFLLLVFLYLLFPKFKGLNMAGSTYLIKEYGFTWISIPVIQKKIKKYNVTGNEIVKRYDEASPKVSKFSLVLLIPLGAIVLAGLFINKRRPFFDHFILSAELVSFYILIVYLITPLISWLVEKIIPQYRHVFDEGSGLEWVIGVLFGIFIVVSFKNFYKGKYWVNILKAIIFLVAFFVGIHYVYRLIVFLLTMLFV